MSQSECMIVEKKSKFIANVSPVNTEEEALEFLKSIKLKYPDANHHVYAYVIDDNNISRYSDDKEPSKTAGMPVLDTIKKEGLVDICVVITRYFGGTLLGTGGLVHAYSQSAKNGILKSGIITRALCNILKITVEYTLCAKVQHLVQSKNLLIKDTIYSDDVTFYICVLVDETQNLINEITELTCADAKILVTEQKYIDLKG